MIDEIARIEVEPLLCILVAVKRKKEIIVIWLQWWPSDHYVCAPVNAMIFVTNILS